MSDHDPLTRAEHSMVPGGAVGEVLRLDEPLSFWGGLDPATGRIIDRHHPQVGESVTGRVIAMPFGRGSSSASSALCEAVRAGTGPAAILMGEFDEIVALGAIAADEVYGVLVPVLVLPEGGFDRLPTGQRVRIGIDGTVYSN
ncbi:MAG TPA: aconitase subunit 2 [Acidimicrobiaceae bacterium]|nr:aconitase subunit 2 [Acidimicrobiaceae bacterium]HAQ23562.1 aconitase subunit 2 [Acidimicrobiaceae bacterium]HCV34439.1 aconitase subunit 2 [Acidimicrobiaceae bacterium]